MTTARLALPFSLAPPAPARAERALRTMRWKGEQVPLGREAFSEKRSRARKRILLLLLFFLFAPLLPDIPHFSLASHAVHRRVLTTYSSLSSAVCGSRTHRLRAQAASTDAAYRYLYRHITNEAELARRGSMPRMSHSRSHRGPLGRKGRARGQKGAVARSKEDVRGDAGGENDAKGRRPDIRKSPFSEKSPPLALPLACIGWPVLHTFLTGQESSPRRSREGKGKYTLAVVFAWDRTCLWRSIRLLFSPFCEESSLAAASSDNVRRLAYIKEGRSPRLPLAPIAHVDYGRTDGTEEKKSTHLGDG